MQERINAVSVQIKSLLSGHLGVVEPLLSLLKSYREYLWFNKPIELSPMVCSSHGWINVGPDALECDCGSVLKVVIEHPDEIPHWIGLLSSAHHDHCLYSRFTHSIPTFPILADDDLAQILSRRYTSLQLTPLLPSPLESLDDSINSSTHSNMDKMGLILAGWETKNGQISCSYCLRTLVLDHEIDPVSEHWLHCPWIVKNKTGLSGHERARQVMASINYVL